MISKGFEVPVDGKMVRFPAGASVPDNICDACKLLEKGLVEPSGEVAGSSPDTPSSNKPARKKGK